MKRPYWDEDDEAAFLVGDAETRGRLLMKIAQGVAGRSQFAFCGLDFEDMVGEILLPLWSASRNFDPKKGKAFSYFSMVAVNAGRRAAGIATKRRNRECEAVEVVERLLGNREIHFDDEEDNYDY